MRTVSDFRRHILRLYCKQILSSVLYTIYSHRKRHIPARTRRTRRTTQTGKAEGQEFRRLTLQFLDYPPFLWYDNDCKASRISSLAAPAASGGILRRNPCSQLNAGRDDTYSFLPATTYQKGGTYMAKRYEDLTFTDDFMFCKVLENNPELCRELTSLLLDRPIGKIVLLQGQKEIRQTSDGRGVRFDVYFEDDDSQIYNIEMQPALRKDIPRRSRYYQSMIDQDHIEPGMGYDSLPNSYVIFISLNNLFPDIGLHRYTFTNKCHENPDLELGDGTTKIFICAKGKDDSISSKTKSFLKFLTDQTAEDDFTISLKNAIENLRISKRGRKEYMTLQEKLYDAKKEGLAEGRKEGREEGREEERQNTDRERRRAEAAEEKVRQLEAQLAALQGK